MEKKNRREITMKYEITGGSLPVLCCHLETGEKMISESGGRTWVRGNIKTETQGGGAKKMFGRLLSGESFFMSHYTAESAAEIAFTSSFPGCIVPIELGEGESVICQKSSFLCATAEVQLSMFFNKKVGAGLFGGEGFIMQKVQGPGTVFLEIDGHCTEYDLAPGEKLVCDTGVLASMDETCSIDVVMVKGVKNMVFGGEGLIDTVITGPGKVRLQSMTIPKIAGLVAPYISTPGS